MEMLESIITSKARIKLLLKFFSNPQVKAYLRELSSEFNGSTNSMRIELNRLVKARLLKSEQMGRNKYYSADVTHPLYPELHKICHKITGINQIHNLLGDLGDVTSAYVVGDYARGIDGGIIDLILVGQLNGQKVLSKVSQTEKMIGRKIRTLNLLPEEFSKMQNKFKSNAIYLVWGKELIK